MRTTSLAISLGFAGAFVTGCVEQPDLGTNQNRLTFEEWKATQYRDATGLYVLDGDTPIRSEARLFDIWSGAQPGQLAVYTSNGQDVKWSATQRLQLTYCVSNNFGATNKQKVITALTGAAEGGWEMMADVDFIYVPAQDANCTASNTAVLFDVNPVNANGEYLARAFFPDSPRADRNILIDASAFDPQLTWPLRNILAHEMGHTLGLRHEHTRPESGATQCFEDNQYRGLTPYDAASVMHYPQCNGTSADLSFTALDRQGIAALYGAPAPNPAPMAQFNAPANGATVPPTFDVQTQIVDTDLDRVELWLDGGLAETKIAPPFTFTITDHVVGPVAIEIRAIDQRGQQTSQSINVTVALGAPDPGPGPGPGPDDTDGDGYGDEITGGCATGGADGSGGLALVGLGLALALRRRQR
ncbi:MAG: matrixin family metalloprotease [Myxococcales bacterium]|nr:matrixin family metalloprotease [Myxococcales bacterium]